MILIRTAIPVPKHRKTLARSTTAPKPVARVKMREQGSRGDPWQWVVLGPMTRLKRASAWATFMLLTAAALMALPEVRGVGTGTAGGGVPPSRMTQQSDQDFVLIVTEGDILWAAGPWSSETGDGDASGCLVCPPHPHQHTPCLCPTTHVAASPAASLAPPERSRRAAARARASHAWRVNLKRAAPLLDEPLHFVAPRLPASTRTVASPTPNCRPPRRLTPAPPGVGTSRTRTRTNQRTPTLRSVLPPCPRSPDQPLFHSVVRPFCLSTNGVGGMSSGDASLLSSS